MVHQLWNSVTHPIVRLENDWNDMERTAHEKTASYIIRKNDSYYEAIKGGTATAAGTVVYGGSLNEGGTDGTDAAAVINAALANLTAGRTSKETVYIKGDIALDGLTSLTVYSYTRIVLDGKISFPAGNTIVIPMVINADTAAGNSYIEITGGVWDGGWNGAAVAVGGNIFQFDAAGAAYCSYIDIHNIWVSKALDSTFEATRLRYSTLRSIHRIVGGQGYRHALNLTTVSDCEFIDIVDDSSFESIIITGGTACLFSHLYIGGGCFSGGVAAVYLYGLTNCNFSNIFIDYVYQHGLYVRDANQMVFNCLHVTDCNADNLYGIYCRDSTNLTFNGGYVGLQSATGHDWYYCVYAYYCTTVLVNGFLLEDWATTAYNLRTGTHAACISNSTFETAHSIGVIATPFPADTGYVNDIASVQAAPTSTKVYTVNESAKMFICTVAPSGVGANIAINATSIGAVTGSWVLEVGDTLTVTDVGATGVWFVFPNRS